MSNIRITILGSGSMVPTKYRNPAGFLIEVDSKKILLDCGHGIIRRLTDYGFNIQDIDIVFISHFHTDHFGDAFNLVHSRFVDDMYNARKNKELLYLCPRKTGLNYKSWRKIFWPESNEYYPIKFKEGTGKYKFGNITIETFPVKHVRWFQSLGIIIKYENKKIVYTGDIGSDNKLVDLVKKCQQADLLITEASYTKPTPNHYTIKQVKELKEGAKIRKVLVMHIRLQHEETIKKEIAGKKDFIIKKDGEVVII